MITILKSGYLKIMQLFYENKEARLHLREIARKTGLYEPSTTKFLNSLEHEGILKYEKEGNLKKYFLKRDKTAYLIFETFDLSKFDKLPLIRKKAIDYYLNKLPEKPVFVILFGSTAKENYNESSDIDLLLITNRRINPKEAEKEADALASTKISTFQMTYKEFIKEIRLKEDKVVQSAMNTGYPLINHISYYEAKYNERI